MHHFLIGYFTDTECPSLRGYCSDHEIKHLRKSMLRFINGKQRLRTIAEGNRRTRAKHRQEALVLIQRRYPAPAPDDGGEDAEDHADDAPAPEQEEGGDVVSDSSSVTQESVELGRNQTRTIFRFEVLRSVAADLDFLTPMRKARGKPEKEIPLHDRKNADANMRYHVFDLANRVMAKSKLSSGQRQEVLRCATKVVFYDNGYKTFRGVSNLDRLWRRRLTLLHELGNDANPLQAKHKGSTACTDKLEKAHPGYVRQLFRAAQKEVGNQATFLELANERDE